MTRNYENPVQPEQVEESDGHPLAEVAILLGAVVAIGAGLVAALAIAATWLAPKIPFRVEQQFAQRFLEEWKAPQDDASAARERALRDIADRLAARMDLPPGISVTVHYAEGPALNAFATVGGHIVIYRGLIERMPSEEALAAVIAHEIAHVRHRHPAASVGRGVAVALVLSVVSASAGNSVASRLFGVAPNLTLLKFSRDQESEADADAIQAIGRVYGHVGGVRDLFRVFQAARPDAPSSAQFFLTHPLTAGRLRGVDAAVERGEWKALDTRTPLADVLKASRKNDT